jgi:hypothetical protein
MGLVSQWSPEKPEDHAWLPLHYMMRSRDDGFSVSKRLWRKRIGWEAWTRTRIVSSRG